MLSFEVVWYLPEQAVEQRVKSLVSWCWPPLHLKMSLQAIRNSDDLKVTHVLHEITVVCNDSISPFIDWNTSFRMVSEIWLKLMILWVLTWLIGSGYFPTYLKPYCVIALMTWMLLCPQKSQLLFPCNWWSCKGLSRRHFVFIIDAHSSDKSNFDELFYFSYFASQCKISACHWVRHVNTSICWLVNSWELMEYISRTISIQLYHTHIFI